MSGRPPRAYALRPHRGGEHAIGPHDRAPDSRRLAANLARVREDVARACDRSRRDPSSVRLVAVTKSVGADVAAELVRLGVEDLGENRTDALVAKRAAVAACGVTCRWHMIGHLQTNKVRRALPAIDVLHSLDRDSLRDALAAELARSPARPPLPALLQVNVSGETTKGGYGAEQALDALRRARAVAGLAIRGMMTMAPAAADPEEARPVFRRLRELRDEAASCGYLGGLDLSMGMSSDFAVAVEEGATIVRIGTLLVAG